MDAKHGRPRRARSSRRPPPGASPGTMVVDPSLPPPVMRVIQYGPDAVSERKLSDPGEAPDLLGQAPVTWIDVDGLGNPRIMTRLGEALGLHRLSVSDIVHTHQRSKAEDYGSYVFIVVRMPRQGHADGLETEQVSLALGANFVATFQEQDVPGDCFEPVRTRIRQGIGRIRAAGPDYLAYALIDAAIDAFFPELERIGEQLDSLEEGVLARPEPRLLSEIHRVRRELIAVRRAIWPTREALGTLVRDGSPLIGSETRVYLRDCHDHTVQIIDLVEAYRDIDASVMDVYLSSVSNRMNEVMKVLTVIATVFIPLTFLVGVYGMNFDPASGPLSMPELSWRYGYVALWAVMAGLAGLMLWLFRRKGWI